MYRNYWNEKIKGNNNQKVSASAPVLGWQAARFYGKYALSKIRQRLIEAAIIRDLSRLDDRILADIGLNRSAISHVAAKTAAEKVERVDFNFTSMIRDVFVTPYRLWRERARTIRELQRLSDRDLLDIGVFRADIKAIAQEIVTLPVGKPKMVQTSTKAKPEINVIHSDSLVRKGAVNTNRPGALPKDQPSAA